MALTVGPPGQGQIWVYDLAGQTQPAKLTVRDHNLLPTWSPDGKEITFMVRTGATSRIVAVPTDGSVTQPKPVSTAEGLGVPLGWSPDGALLLFGRPEPPRLWLMNRSDAAVRRWLQSDFTEVAARFSPDGNWMAYGSDQTGELEIWVRPFPGPGAPVRVSAGGGRKPIWSHDGRQIFYERGDTMMAAAITTRGGLVSGQPRVLFEGGFQRDDTDPHMRLVDVAADGRFLAVAPNAPGAASVVVAQHWTDEVARLLPTK